jgi:hypothetical protein
MASRRIQGWYCNITRPARIEDGHVRFEDLALDLSSCRMGWCMLDEDEFDGSNSTAGARCRARWRFGLAQEHRPFAINANHLPLYRALRQAPPKGPRKLCCSISAAVITFGRRPGAVEGRRPGSSSDVRGNDSATRAQDRELI